MSRMVVVIGEAIGEENLARLVQAHPDLEFRYCVERENYLANVSDAEIIFSKQFPPGTLDIAQKLRWIQAGTAGVNHLLAAGIGERGIRLTNARGAHGTPIAEQTLALMFAFANRLPTLIRAQATGKQVARQVIAEKFELAGQTLCVIGLGDIGGALAQKAKLLGIRVLGVRRTAALFLALIANIHLISWPWRCRKPTMFALCLPLTAATTAIIGEPELRLMRPNAYIYNVGRGASIAPDALIRALQEGWIAGAGLDCTDPEPLPADSPLWGMDNVILAQHTSGSSPYNADRITQIFLNNLDCYRRGEGLKNVVDVVQGY